MKGLEKIENQSHSISFMACPGWEVNNSKLMYISRTIEREFDEWKSNRYRKSLLLCGVHEAGKTKYDTIEVYAVYAISNLIE